MQSAKRRGRRSSLTEDQRKTLVQFYHETDRTAKQVARLMDISHWIVSYYWKPLAIKGHVRRHNREPFKPMPDEVESAKLQLKKEIDRAKREMRDPLTPMYDPEDLEY